MSKKITAFIPLHIAILTVSDTRNNYNDTSGQTLEDLAKNDGHIISQRTLVKDDIYQIRAAISQWIFSRDINTIIITGGTGFSGRDSTPEAVIPLFDKTIEGFGELFRQISYEEIGTSTIQSRCIAGIANNTGIFCLPGSTGACTTGWTKILTHQLNSTHKPCNFVEHFLKPNSEQ